MAFGGHKRTFYTIPAGYSISCQYKKRIGTATTTNQPSFPLLRRDTQDYAKKYVENISPMLYHYPI
jgi:hypothetical protein